MLTLEYFRRYVRSSINHVIFTQFCVNRLPFANKRFFFIFHFVCILLTYILHDRKKCALCIFWVHFYQYCVRVSSMNLCTLSMITKGLTINFISRVYLDLASNFWISMTKDRPYVSIATTVLRAGQQPTFKMTILLSWRSKIYLLLLPCRLQGDVYFVLVSNQRWRKR